MMLRGMCGFGDCGLGATPILAEQGRHGYNIVTYGPGLVYALPQSDGVVTEAQFADQSVKSLPGVLSAATIAAADQAVDIATGFAQATPAPTQGPVLPPADTSASPSVILPPHLTLSPTMLFVIGGVALYLFFGRK